MNPIQNHNQMLVNDILNHLEYDKRSIVPPITNRPPSLEREYYVTVDSRYRKNTEQSYKYKLDLNEPLRNIKSITLTNATIPKKILPMDITKTYNLVISLTQKIEKSVDGKSITEYKEHFHNFDINITIDSNGVITVGGLPATVTSYGITLSIIDDKFRITYTSVNDNDYDSTGKTVTSINTHIDRSTLGLGKILGFNTSSIYSDSTTVIADTICMTNISETEENHVYLHIDEFSLFDYTGHRVMNNFVGCVGSKDCFANIALKCDPGKVYYFSEDSPCTIDFKTSKSMLSSLNISWKNIDGSFYEFDEGKDHNLTFKIVCGTDRNN